MLFPQSIVGHQWAEKGWQAWRPWVAQRARQMHCACSLPSAQSEWGGRWTRCIFSLYSRKCCSLWEGPSSTMRTASSSTVPSVPATQKSPRSWWKVGKVGLWCSGGRVGCWLYGWLWGMASREILESHRYVRLTFPWATILVLSRQMYYCLKLIICQFSRSEKF